MSGIAAVLHQAGPAPPGPETRALLDRMLGRMAHRGPHSSTVQNVAQGGLALCLLNTTAESKDAYTPFSSPDGTRWIVADARLDNRGALAAELGLDTAAELSDAALILSAYERWGESSLQHLYGDFAFAIVEPEQRRIFCARDPMGVRPLYYHVDSHRFLCASEITALFADPSLSARPRPDSVALFIVDFFSNCGDTLYESIRSLPAGHHLTATAGALRVSRYWQPDPWRRLPACDEAEYGEALRDTFATVVREQVRSSEPLGVCVSGGIDSSTVAGQVEICRRSGSGPPDKPTVLHVTYPGLACDETAYSDALSAHWDLPSIHTEPLADAEVTRPRVLMDHPELYYDPRWCMWLQLFGAAKATGISTIFTGEGADLYQQPSGYEAADAMRSRHWGAMAEHSELTVDPATWALAARNTLFPLLPHGVRASLRKARRLAQGDMLFTARFSDLFVSHLSQQETDVLGRSAPSLSMAALCANIEESMYHRILTTADLIAATSGVELRHPWLDRRIMELVLAMPESQRYIRDGRAKPKPLMRRALRHLVPRSVADARDAAVYSPYISAVLSDKHGATVRELFRDSRLIEMGIVSAEAVKKRQTEATMLVSNAVAMELWLRQVCG